MSSFPTGHYDGGIGHRRNAFAFVTTSGYTPNGLEVEIAAVIGTMNGNTKLEIWTNVSNKPGSLVANATVSLSDPTGTGFFGGDFASAVAALSDATQYWFVVESSTSTGSTYLRPKGDSAAGETDGIKGDEGTGPSTYVNTWVASADADGTFNFKIYELALVQVNLSGAMPAFSGTISAQFVKKNLAGAMPAQSGALTVDIVLRHISLAGAMPAFSGAIASAFTQFIDLAGAMPAQSGTLTPLYVKKFLAGSWPASTGTIDEQYKKKFLAGEWPAFSGTISVFLKKTLTGAMPAFSGTIGVYLPTWALPVYELVIDRDSDGDFLGGDAIARGLPVVDSGLGGEDVTSDIAIRRGVTTYRGNETIKSISPPRIGSLAFMLTNTDDDYSPGSTVAAGRAVRLRGNVSGTIYELWRGFLQKPQQDPASGNQTVKVDALGLLTRAKGQRVSTALYSDITVDTAIGHVLDAIGWPAGDRTLDSAQTTMTWWWLDEEDAYEALQTLVNTEGPIAALFEGEDGKIIFQSRHHRQLTTASNTPQVTVKSLGQSPNIGGGFVYNDGESEVINEATLVARRRTADATAEVWALGETLVMFADDVVNYSVRDKDRDPFQAAVVPVEDTDFTVTAGAVTPTLNRTSGGVVTLTMTAGAAGATVTGLVMRADLVTVKGETLLVNGVDASASITQYGTKRIPRSYEVRAEVSPSTLQDFTDAIVGTYQGGRPSIRVAIENADSRSLTQQFTRALNDRIRVIAESGNFSLDDEFYVLGIRHRITGQATIRTELECEVAGFNEYAAWDLALWGTSVWGF